MKKKTKIAIVLAILIILLVPIPTKLKDGGTVKYQAILWSVSDVRSLYTKDGADGYIEGVEITFLWFEIYDSTKFVPNE